MGYKLADGSDSEQYKIGDEFEVVCEDSSAFSKGSIVRFCENDNSSYPKFNIIEGECAAIDGREYEYWENLKPHRKPFTRLDFKDGDKIYMEEGVQTRCGDKVDPNKPLYVCGNIAYQIELADICAHLELHLLNDNLATPRGAKIARVIRDGTVLFEREPEKKKVTLELTDKQIESLKQQGLID